jgi:hypothetical protein
MGPWGDQNARAFPFPGEAWRGSSGRRPFGCLTGFFLRAWRGDVALDRLQGSTSHTAYVIGAMPKIRFPLALPSGVSQAIPQPARTGRCAVVDQGRDMECGMATDEPMGRIRFAPAFDQRPTPPAAPRAVLVSRSGAGIGSPARDVTEVHTRHESGRPAYGPQKPWRDEPGRWQQI